MPKLILFLLSSVSLSCLTNCASVPDFFVCTELGPTRAFCTKSVSDEDFIWDETNKIDGKTYWDERPAMILLPPKSWAMIKTNIIKNCKKHKDCNVKIDTWERKLNSVEKKQ